MALAIAMATAIADVRADRDPDPVDVSSAQLSVIGSSLHAAGKPASRELARLLRVTRLTRPKHGKRKP